MTGENGGGVRGSVDYRRWGGWVVVVALLSAVFGFGLLNYTSYAQMKLFMPIRQLVYFDDNSSSECEKKFGGFGSLYKSGCFLNPLHVAQEVLPYAQRAFWGESLESHEVGELMRVLKILKDHAYLKRYHDKSALILPYQFSWPRYDLGPGWSSGMAQGFAAEVALGGYLATGKKKYRELAVAFANAFFVPVDKGGVSVRLENGIWLEEYAQKGKEPSYALNGHVFALRGVRKVSTYAPEFKAVLESALRATRERLPMYDGVFWSKYDLRGTVANQKYHHVHIKQLHWLEFNFGGKRFEKYADTFQRQQMYPFGVAYRMVVYPHRFLVFLFVVNWLAALTVTVVAIYVVGIVKRRKVT